MKWNLPLRTLLRTLLLTLLATLPLLAPRPAAGQGPIVVEAESAVAASAKIYRDPAASGKAVVVVMLSKETRALLATSKDLPAGDYIATFHLQAVPVATLHALEVAIAAGGESRRINAYEFDPRPIYQPFALAFTHPGGSVRLEAAASGESGFNGMRAQSSDDEKQMFQQMKADEGHLLARDKAKQDEADAFELEENPLLSTLNVLDPRVVCDRVELTPLRLSPSVVEKVEVDKIHYFPGETVKATVTLRGGAAGEFELLAEDISEIDAARPVGKQQVTLAAGQSVKVELSFALEATEFGHELRVNLRQGDKTLHSGSAFFGVSENVYRVGITGDHGGHDKQRITPELAAKLMQQNKARYANYFECFAWAPCDLSEMSPDTELFWSGQTQYPGSVANFKSLLAAAHQYGVKGITYGKACAGGIEGFYTYQEHPEFFNHSPNWGPGTESFNTFYLERMLHNEYNLGGKDGVRGWQHWASLWCRMDSQAAVDFSADETLRSAEQIGWDGIRWDGHFIGQVARFKDRVNAKAPRFVHGYNIAFANPGSSLFMPPQPNDDFLAAAKNHGLLMDESVRDWSNTNFSSGQMRPWWEAVCREADYEKRIGGLPLFITFDMGSKQDQAFNVLCGLSAGQRYTYMNSPGDFAFGALPRWLTRYSALVWDDTALLKDPDSVLEVAVAGAKAQAGAAPWWRWSTWLRKLPAGRQQLLINLLNPPQYPAYCNRVQTPPQTLTDVRLTLQTPAGAKVLRVVHASPDLALGHEILAHQQEGQACQVTVARLRNWSIVAIELAGDGQELAYPAFALSQPIEDAERVLAEGQKKQELAQEQAKKKAEAGIGAPTTAPAAQKAHFEDFEKHYNVDAEVAAKLKRPADMNIRRNGVLDVHHGRGAFFWCNPVEEALGLVGGGSFTASYVDRVGFRLRGDGCMDGFPDNYESLLACDVLVLDNLQVVDLGATRRALIRDYVENGGSVLYLGGSFNLSFGAERNSALDDLLPIEIRKYRDDVRDDQGLKLAPVDAAWFGPEIDWNAGPCAYDVDVSPLREGANPLLTAGGRPAIVLSSFGKGKVITVLMNSHGSPAAGTLPYWQWKSWPRVLAACLRHLGQGAETQYQAKLPPRQIDPKKPTPDDLMLEALDLDHKEFTSRLRAAKDNMIDAQTSRVLLEVAIDNAGKIDDPELLPQVAEIAGGYVDASFVKLAEKLVGANEDFLRRAGYQVLGLAGRKDMLPKLRKGLQEAESWNQREALIALARLDDKQAIADVRGYLKKGQEKMLALTVLLRLGEEQALSQSLPLYIAAAQRRIALKAARISAYEGLYGGTSFKLTPAARRKAQHEYNRIVETEGEADFDVRYYRAALVNLNDAQLATLTDFLVGCESYLAGPLAYGVFGKLPAEKAAPFRQRLSQAKLQSLRNLAN